MELLISEDTKNIKKLVSILESEDYRIKQKDEVDIGAGADWVFIPYVIAAGAFFFSGKKIEENIQAWISMGKKIRKLFKKKKKASIFIDKDAAIALAISLINKKEKIESLEITFDKELGHFDLNKVYKDGRQNTLSAKPYNYYVLIFNINDISTYIFCIKSDGTIQFKDVFFGEEYDYHKTWNTIGK